MNTGPTGDRTDRRSTPFGIEAGRRVSRRVLVVDGAWFEFWTDR